MTWKEMIDALTPESMPTVEWNGNRGIITEIKSNARHRGITVQFEHLNYGTWFWEGHTDGRSKSIQDLKLIERK